jgi:hypothetical protein
MAELTAEVRAALAAMGEDPEAVERYLASDMPDMRRKGTDRVRAAEARVRQTMLVRGDAAQDEQTMRGRA